MHTLSLAGAGRLPGKPVSRGHGLRRPALSTAPLQPLATQDRKRKCRLEQSSCRSGRSGIGRESDRAKACAVPATRELGGRFRIATETTIFTISYTLARLYRHEEIEQQRQQT